VTSRRASALAAIATIAHGLGDDTLFVLAGLPDLREQIARDSSQVGRAVRGELAALATKESFIDAVRGHFEGDNAGQARASRVVAWLATLSTSRTP
jgi:hypothetical protein